MSTRLKPYPSYKDSGVEWLGRIPAQWRVKRLRFATTVNPSKTELRGLSGDTVLSFLPMERIGEDGSLDLGETRRLDQVAQGFTYFRDGDVLVAKITPCFENGKGGICRGLLGGVGFGTTEFHVLRPLAEIDSAFLFYITKSTAFRWFGMITMYGAAGQQRVSEEFIRDFGLPLPKLAEQQAIAGFLDRETGKIDALVKKKERLIELLQEKRTALISHAVTQGLNPNAPKKDSGIPWLGHIPNHWEVKPLKRLGALKGGSGFPDSEQGIENEALPFYKVSDMNLEGNEVVMRSHNNSISPGTARRLGATVFPRDAVIFPKVGAALLTNKRRILSRPACIDNNTMAFTVTEGVVKFLFYRLLCFDLGRLANPGAVPSLNEKEASEIAVAVPPTSEQEQIVAHLDRETAKLDALMAKVRTAIERLQEYRTALISAAVTGQIDVRSGR